MGDELIAFTWLMLLIFVGAWLAVRAIGALLLGPK